MLVCTNLDRPVTASRSMERLGSNGGTLQHLRRVFTYVQPLSKVGCGGSDESHYGSEEAGSNLPVVTDSVRVTLM